MSIVGPLRKFSADVLDSNVQKIFNFKGFSLCLCVAKIFYFILFYLNWQTRLLESDITPILQNESIQSDT